MSLLRFFGLESGPYGGSRDGFGETESVRRISSQLDRLPADSARFLAAFACVLSRVAHADLSIDDAERQAIREAVHDHGSLDEQESELVVEIATSQIRDFGGTEGYVVTREFREIATSGEKARLLRCLFAVAAADGTISTEESGEVAAIGEELGFSRAEVLGVRSQWKAHLAEFQNDGKR